MGEGNIFAVLSHKKRIAYHRLTNPVIWDDFVTALDADI